MATRQSFEYSRSPIGIPSVLLAVAWVVIWALWPSFDNHTDGPRRRASRTAVSYGAFEESLYMSPLLFARATRVGFRAPQAAMQNTEVLDRYDQSPPLRFLHVTPPDPDFGGLRRESPTIGTRGYRPVWKDDADFTTVTSTNRVMITVRSPLKERGYQPVALHKIERGSAAEGVDIEAFVGLSADGIPQNVFLEKPSGDKAIDGAVVRALERGRGRIGATPVSGRVIVTIRRVDESSD